MQVIALAVVLTFDPHPAKVFGRGDIKLLTLPGERAKLLGNMGVDVVVTHPFDRDVANITAFDFMNQLKERLGLEHLVLGYDSALGKNREGNTTRLTEIGRELGYTVEVVSALGDESGVISSTEIRKLISAGEVAEAAKLNGASLCFAGTGRIWRSARAHDRFSDCKFELLAREGNSQRRHLCLLGVCTTREVSRRSQYWHEPNLYA